MKVDLLNQLIEKYSGKLDVLTIYIREAHPSNEWKWEKDPISASIKQPETIQERLELARDFKTKTNLKSLTLVDPLDNNLEKSYLSWPERLYLIHQGKIIYVGGPGPFGYIPEEVDKFLQSYY